MQQATEQRLLLVEQLLITTSRSLDQLLSDKSALQENTRVLSERLQALENRLASVERPPSATEMRPSATEMHDMSHTTKTDDDPRTSRSSHQKDLVDQEKDKEKRTDVDVDVDVHRRLLPTVQPLPVPHHDGRNNHGHGDDLHRQGLLRSGGSGGNGGSGLRLRTVA